MTKCQSILLLIIIEFLCHVLADSFYCKNGETLVITNQSVGFIKTREQEDGFYANNLLCSWKIDAGENRLIKLTIDVADLQWSPQYTTCSGYDNLQIIEGESIKNRSITSVCGARNPYNVISRGRFLFLQFSSTHQNFGNKRGVEITFETFERQSCAPGWFQVEGEPDSCYMIGSIGTASWTDSQDICSYSRSNLASIRNETVYQTIIEMGNNVSLSSAWIGLSDMQAENTFRWLDRSSYPFIRDIQENDFRKHCVSIDFETEEWLVQECKRTLLNYICKAKKDGSTILYSAEPASGAPEEVEESNNKTFLIVILIIVGVLFIAGLALFVRFCILKRTDRPKSPNRSRPHRSNKQEDPVFSALQVTSASVGPNPGPTAPPSEDVMLHDYDPQRIAPPTYEESLQHPISPSNF